VSGMRYKLCSIGSVLMELHGVQMFLRDKTITHVGPIALSDPFARQELST
jgi:hypothetical protein